MEGREWLLGRVQLSSKDVCDRVIIVIFFINGNFILIVITCECRPIMWVKHVNVVFDLLVMFSSIVVLPSIP